MSDKAIYNFLIKIGFVVKYDQNTFEKYLMYFDKNHSECRYYIIQKQFYLDRFKFKFGSIVFPGYITKKFKNSREIIRFFSTTIEIPHFIKLNRTRKFKRIKESS